MSAGAAGTLVAGYRLEEPIGEGGMATVWRGVHPTLGTTVAVKVLDPVLARDPGIRERLADEARIQATLRHPNILKVENFWDDPPAIVTELVEGRPLSERIRHETGPLPIDRALPVMRSEVTNAAYERCADAGRCRRAHYDDGTCRRSLAGEWGEGRVEDARIRAADHPVVCVDWQEAAAFCAWAGGRLASEAEWEYIARGGGREQTYPWGDARATCARAVMRDGGPGCGTGATAPVCSRPAGHTRPGVCDLAGNVFEWTADSWHRNYRGAPSDGRPWTSARGEPERKVQRGGSWRFPDDAQRVANRGILQNWKRSVSLGFRCVRDP